MTQKFTPVPCENPRAALLWQLEHGIDLPLGDEIFVPATPKSRVAAGAVVDPEPMLDRVADDRAPEMVGLSPAVVVEGPAGGAIEATMPKAAPIIITDDNMVAARSEAVRLAQAAQTLEELAQAIASFDGVSIKRHATNMVFADGSPKSRIMVVGEAPGADEDQAGKPFVGPAGHLFDRMFAAIGLARSSDDPAHSIYISNVLNWRPPGNRSPTAAEIELSLPFIERHIQLIAPDILVLSGGVAAKALMNTTEGITKIRGKWAMYRPMTLPGNGIEIPCLPLYHPSFLLRTPIKKREAWADLLALQAKIITKN